MTYLTEKEGERPQIDIERFCADLCQNLAGRDAPIFKELGKPSVYEGADIAHAHSVSERYPNIDRSIRFKKTDFEVRFEISSRAGRGRVWMALGHVGDSTELAVTTVSASRDIAPIADAVVEKLLKQIHSEEVQRMEALSGMRRRTNGEGATPPEEQDEPEVPIGVAYMVPVPADPMMAMLYQTIQATAHTLGLNGIDVIEVAKMLISNLIAVAIMADAPETAKVSDYLDKLKDIIDPALQDIEHGAFDVITRNLVVSRSAESTTTRRRGSVAAARSGKSPFWVDAGKRAFETRVRNHMDRNPGMSFEDAREEVISGIRSRISQRPTSH